MDETGFLWKRLPAYGLKTLSIGKKLDKTRITVNLCCNENSSDKLPLWFIGKAQQLRCFAQNHVYYPENKDSFGVGILLLGWLLRS
jgi:DDE superfamily endonuclease